MSGDEKFQLVGRRKRGKLIPRLINEDNSASCRAESLNFDADKFTRKLNEAKEELNDSEYKKKLFHRLAEAKEILNAADVKQILCYGLGNFSVNSSSKYQLALLLVIKDHLRANVHVYDPLFLTDEILYLESLNFSVIRENEEGKRKVDSTTLVYLPHCSKQLTNNFLFANWSSDLTNCILFSNSFTLTLQSLTDKVLDNTARYIARINPFVVEIELTNCFKHRNVFNDSALHVFSRNKFDDIPKAFWEDKEEPRYLEQDIEFVANSVTNKLIPRTMNANLKVLRSLISEIRYVASEKKMQDNVMVRYILEQSRIHRDTSEVLCKAREELKSLGETYLHYLKSQRKYNEIRKHYGGRGERSVKETADLVGFKLPHDPK